MNRSSQSNHFCKRFLELYAPQAITVLATLAYLFMAFATVKCEAGGDDAPPLFNLGVDEMDVMFWDGRVSRDSTTGVLTTPESDLNGSSPARADIAAQLSSALAAQAMFPVTSNEEMRGQPGNDIRDAANNQATWAALMARLVGTGNGSSGGLASYRTMFSAAFPAIANYDDLNFGHAARAIAAYERQTFLSVGSPFDRYLAGDLLALSDSEKRGALTFFGGAGGCSGCHSGPLLTDKQFHGIAAPQLGPGASGGDDLGRQLISGNGGDAYEFRTPPLRNVALTAPYTHAGAYASLESVIAHYANTAAGIQNYDSSQLGRSDYIATVDANATRIEARIDARDRRVARPRRLSPGQRADLVAFLRSLSDPAMVDMSGEIPTAVPSGLSLAD